jgi:hypothetical protein
MFKSYKNSRRIKNVAIALGRFIDAVVKTRLSRTDGPTRRRPDNRALSTVEDFTNAIPTGSLDFRGVI